MKKKRHLCMLLILMSLLVSALFAFTGAAEENGPKISRKELTLYAGNSYKMKTTGFDGEVRWSSSDKEVAKVNRKGRIFALKSGTATIIARCGDQKKKCTLTVRTVQMSRSTAGMARDSMMELELLCGEKDGIVWESSNPEIVRIMYQAGNKVTLRACYAHTSDTACFR